LRLSLAANHPLSPSFVIIDEGFGCLDPQHLENTIEYLHKLKIQNLDWLLFVSHLPQMKHISSTDVAIVSVNGASKVRYE
jgi:DNA repair exonuclease SbcCD ATPase subunit